MLIITAICHFGNYPSHLEINFYLSFSLIFTCLALLWMGGMILTPLFIMMILRLPQRYQLWKGIMIVISHHFHTPVGRDWLRGMLGFCQISVLCYETVQLPYSRCLTTISMIQMRLTCCDWNVSHQTVIKMWVFVSFLHERIHMHKWIYVWCRRVIYRIIKVFNWKYQNRIHAYTLSPSDLVSRARSLKYFIYVMINNYFHVYLL